MKLQHGFIVSLSHHTMGGGLRLLSVTANCPTITVMAAMGCLVTVRDALHSVFLWQTTKNQKDQIY